MKSKMLKLLKPYLPFIVLSLLSSLITVAMQLYAPILSGRAIDLIAGKGKVALNDVTRLLIWFIVTIIISCIFQWISSAINNKIVYNVVKELRDRIYRHLNTLPLSFIDSHEYGDIVSRTLTDVDQLSDGLLMGFTQMFTGVITIIGTIVFMLRTSVPVALVVIVLTPMSLFVAAFVTKKTYSMFRRQSEERAEMTSLVNETIGNEKLVQTFSYEERAGKRFEAINEKLADAEFRATFFSSLTNPSTRFVNNIVYAGVALVGGFMVLGGRLSVGQLTIFLSYATQYAKPFNEISGVMTELTAAMASLSRVFELLEAEPEKDAAMSEDADNGYLMSGSDVNADGVDQAVKSADTKGEVSLQDISFSYDKTKKLIEHLSLEVKDGEKVAIVGPTGSGKSTLINLLMRFYDVDSGRILINGDDIKSQSRSSVRHRFGMVLQETWLKSGTIRENIAYGYPDATDEEVYQAAAKTHADRFIRRLEKGYDTVLSEDGGSLSEGQRQLLSITRVMLRLPHMLILDEATSSIDTRTEQRIQRSFDKMMKGRTSFVVAHRLSTIRESDVILVMKDGDVIEQGSHEELLSKKGFYYDLYNSQFVSTLN